MLWYASDRIYNCAPSGETASPNGSPALEALILEPLSESTPVAVDRSYSVTMCKEGSPWFQLTYLKEIEHIHTHTHTHTAGIKYMGQVCRDGGTLVLKERQYYLERHRLTTNNVEHKHMCLRGGWELTLSSDPG